MKALYTKDYQILGIQPGCTWLDLKEKYRQIVKKWHPDRFYNQPQKKELAEEKIKEVNRAFDSLSNYYKKFGTLPITAHETTFFGQSASKSPAFRTDTRPSQYDNDTVSSDAQSNDSKWATSFRMVVAMIVIGFFSWQFLVKGPDQEGTSPKIEARRMQEFVMRYTPLTNSEQSIKQNEFFSFGSSWSEVQAIQGIPSKIEFGIWYYGKSKVFFLNRMVSGWENNPSNPLKVANAPEPASTASYFTTGSTKADVRTVQGEPLRKGENEWDYGISKVYFKGNRVTGWYNSIFNPLKIDKKDQN